MTYGGTLFAAYYNAHRSRLPAGYREVEYLESTGAQWIDTGCPLTESSKVETLVHDVNISRTDEQMVFGAKSADNVAGFWMEFYRYPSGYACISSENNYRLIEPQLTQSYHIIQSIADGIVINGTQLKQFPSTGPFTTVGCVIFGYSGLIYRAKLKMDFFRVWLGGSLLARDFIPCVRASDNKPGMYDLCGSTCPLTNSPLYINVGTGADFTWGEL